MKIRFTAQQRPVILASLATIGFLIAGIFSVWFFVLAIPTALPLIIFYTVLVINTFFSVKLFTSIIPKKNILQDSIDVVLILLYLNVAMSMRNVTLFIFSTLLLFIVATAKYAFLLNIIPYKHLLKRKILIDLLGVFDCVVCLSITTFFSSTFAAWLLSITFFLANIILLLMWPMYTIPAQDLN